jgi:hypothetical protein
LLKVPRGLLIQVAQFLARVIVELWVGIHGFKTFVDQFRGHSFRTIPSVLAPCHVDGGQQP